MSESRRELVLRAADEIGYRANHLARSLKSRRTHVVGFCAPMLSSAYFSALVEAVHDQSVLHRQQVMQVLSGGEPKRELERVDSLLSRQVDGLILMPSSAPAATLDLLERSRVPAVIVDRMLPDDRFDLVLLDHASAMREVVEHLAGLGHRRLVFVVRHPDLVTTRIRIDTLRAVARMKGLPTPELLVTTDEAADLPRELPRLLQRSSATAAITSNSINTLWALRSLRGAGVRIPDDVSLVAFDEPAWGELVDPPLTVVKQPTEQIASSAWSLLMRRIVEPDGPRTTLLLHNQLVVRGSTGQPRMSGRV